MNNFSFLTKDRSILLCAHRGQSETRPENTMAAFEEARILGASSIELDTMLTKNGEIVVIHDQNLERTTGIFGLVNDFTSIELKKLFASNKFSNFKNEPIPTLKQVIDWSQKNSLGLEIEVKESNNIDTYINSLVTLLQTYKSLNNIMIIGFDHTILKTIKQKIAVKTEVIIHCRPVDIMVMVKSAEADAVSLEFDMFNLEDAKKLKKENIIIRLTIPPEADFKMDEKNNLFKLQECLDLVDLITGNDILFIGDLLNKIYKEDEKIANFA